MKKLYSFNSLTRIIFLLLTPVFFQYFGLGFIWHSIYWGVITSVLLIWSVFILVTPLFGRVGCGWFCFMGTTLDLVGEHSFKKTNWKKPKLWTRLLILIPFLLSAFTFFFLNSQSGMAHGFKFDPGFIKLDFSDHYKIAWVVDISAATIISLFLDKRWGCKNLCFMGTLCSAGAKYSRLIPVVEKNKCTLCSKCDKDCLTGIRITDYVKDNNGLVTNPECVVCGKCVKTCSQNAVKLKFVWNRKNYVKSLNK